MFIDVSAQGEKIVNGFRRPQERHTPRGDRRSFGVSQEATHSLTRACAIPLPRSSEARARVMPEICHSLVSRRKSLRQRGTLCCDQCSWQAFEASFWLKGRGEPRRS